MGISPFRPSPCEACGGQPCPTSLGIPAVPPPNPDPQNFTVLRHYSIAGWTVVEVQYPDCTNYEGRKVLVYRARLVDVLALKIMDPHFCDDGHLAPFARFEPTARGWRAAQQLIGALP